MLCVSLYERLNMLIYIIFIALCVFFSVMTNSCMRGAASYVGRILLWNRYGSRQIFSRGDKSTTQYPLVYLNRNNEIGIIQVGMNFEVLTVDISKLIAYLEVQ